MARRSVLNRSFSTSEKVLMLVLAVLLVPSLFIFLWMTVFGNGAIWIDRNVVGGALSRLVDNPDILLFSFFESFPMAKAICVLAVAMIAIFFVTSADSGILVMNSIFCTISEDIIYISHR